VKDGGPRVAGAPAPAEQALDTAEARADRFEREAKRLLQRITDLQNEQSRRSEALQAALQAAAGRRIRWGKLPVRITQAAAEFERFLTAG
jgi:hypothetical protein